MTQLVQVGVSHASAPLRWRERLAVASHALGPVAARLARSAAAREALVPTITALREQQRRAVVDVLGDVPDDLVERLVTRLLHAPTARLREAAVSGVGEQWAETARELFALSGDEALRAGRPRRRRAAGAGR